MNTKIIAVLVVVGILLAYGLVSVSASNYKAWCKYSTTKYCCWETNNADGVNCNANSGTCTGGGGTSCTAGYLNSTLYSANAANVAGCSNCAAGGSSWAWSYSMSGSCACAAA